MRARRRTLVFQTETVCVAPLRARPKRRGACKWREEGGPPFGGLSPPASLGNRPPSFSCLTELRARARARGRTDRRGGFVGARNSGLYRGGPTPLTAGWICEPTACPRVHEITRSSPSLAPRERDDTGTGTRRRVLVGRPRRPAIHGSTRALLLLSALHARERGIWKRPKSSRVISPTAQHAPPHVFSRQRLARHGSREPVDRRLRLCGARLVSSRGRPVVAATCRPSDTCV